MHLVGPHLIAPLRSTPNVVLQETLITPARPGRACRHVCARVRRECFPNPLTVGCRHVHEARAHHVRLSEVPQHSRLPWLIGHTKHHRIQIQHQHIALKRRAAHFQLRPPARPVVHQRDRRHPLHRNIRQAHKPRNLSRQPLHMLGLEFAPRAQDACLDQSNTSTVRSQP